MSTARFLVGDVCHLARERVGMFLTVEGDTTP